MKIAITFNLTSTINKTITYYYHLLPMGLNRFERCLHEFARQDDKQSRSCWGWRAYWVLNLRIRARTAPFFFRRLSCLSYTGKAWGINRPWQDGDTHTNRSSISWWYPDELMTIAYVICLSTIVNESINERRNQTDKSNEVILLFVQFWVFAPSWCHPYRCCLKRAVFPPVEHRTLTSWTGEECCDGCDETVL